MFRRVYGAGAVSIYYRFRDQFEDDGNGGFIYRLWRRGRPISVTADERTKFVNRYTRGLIVLYGLALTGGVTFFAFYWQFLHPANVLPSPDPRLWIGFIFSTLPFFLILQWIGYAPARALKSRPSIGPEPSRAEVQADKFSRITYGNLALTALAGASSYIYIAHGHWDRRWIFVPPLVVLVAAVQAFRKWRFESRY